MTNDSFIKIINILSSTLNYFPKEELKGVLSLYRKSKKQKQIYRTNHKSERKRSPVK
jgi:hypothetical protein